jgi:tetratricopeptide (TPR) repeat protein
MLGTLLVQLKKFEPALQHFQKMMDLAREEPKYQELFKFMVAFCYFKLAKQAKAFEELKSIPIADSKFVNKVQYYSMLAHVELKLEKYQEAVQDFQTCIEQLNLVQSCAANEIQMAQLYYELGLTMYNFASKKIRTSMSAHPEIQDSSSILEAAAENFRKAAQIWDANSDYSQAISTYELLADIYRVLNQPETELEVLILALDKANSIKSELQKIRITKRIVQIQERLGKQQDSIKYLQDLQASIQDNTLVDLITASKTHLDTGKTLFAIKRFDDAAKELVTALNSYRRLKVRQKEELDVLKLLIDLYVAKGESEKADYYANQLKSTSNELQKVIPIKKKNMGGLEDV